MKTSLKTLIVATASVVTTAGFAASNLENPLYMPKANEAYVKVGAAYMQKTLETTEATKTKNIAGNRATPIWRFSGDLGYGITDRLDIHGRFGYTNDMQYNRKGMHRGRLGLMFRALTEQSPIVWDLYADAYLSGVSKMKGAYVRLPSGEGAFNYENYSNGRWGVIAGTRLGKTFNDLTLAAHVEYLRTFGNHNNEIKIEHPGLLAAGFPADISVNLTGTSEWTAGFDAMYQLTEKWSLGAGFEFVQHTDNSVESISTSLPATAQPYAAYLVAATADMEDGWDEYVIKLSAAYQMNNTLQLAPFFEYTFDKGHTQSQNSTDYKYEFGVRLNAQF